MIISHQTFWLPKAGNTPEEYEDAFWPRIAGKQESRGLRFAVADGATESSFARLWSRSLVSLYCNPLTPIPLDENRFIEFRLLTERRGHHWFSKVLHQSLPWFAIEKVGQGAFSTLLGVCFEDDQSGLSYSGRWSALAIGDSCLCQIRSGSLLTSFPLESPEDFSYHPLLVSANSDRNRDIWERGPDRLICTGSWQVGDYFLLMTDAMAHWFLSNREKDPNSWQILLDATSSPDHFSKWIAGLRTSKQMRNDDVTLLLIKIDETL